MILRDFSHGVANKKRVELLLSQQKQLITLPTSLFSHTHWFLVNVSAPFRCHDDGVGVGLAEGHASVRQRSGAEGPGRVHVSSPDPLQLRNPPPHIVALKRTHGQPKPPKKVLVSHCAGSITVGGQRQSSGALRTGVVKGNETNVRLLKSYIAVVVEALLDHVELPVLSGIIPDAGAVKPVAIVAADVMVNLLGEH